ncbi:MAG: Rid family detoxifying hydrolase [Flavobacteriaceae bacterium]
MKTIINTSSAPSPIGPYSQAVLHGGTLYASGQIAIEVETGRLRNEDISQETLQVMKNIGAVLEAAEMDYNHILKASIFIKDMDQFTEINQVYAQFFDESEAPARETVEVSRLPKDVNVEISIIASKL